MRKNNPSHAHAFASRGECKSVAQRLTAKQNPGHQSAQARALLLKRSTPAAPPAYRPQPTPKVLQQKAALPPSPSPNNHPRKAQTREHKPVPAPANFRRGKDESINRDGQSKTIQRFDSRVVQAIKYYPNLHPGAVEPVDTANVFRLNSFANQYRLQRVDSHSVNVPNQQYNFVRTREGDMLLHARYRHPSIAEGKQVLYAGEIFFNNGQLEWWSNGSGHYQPYAEDAEQAALPMDQFFSYQQIIKGEHKRKKA